MHTQLERFMPGIVLAAGTGLSAVAAAVTLSGAASDEAQLEALVRVLTVAAPFAVGAYALRRPPFERFGWLLIAGGAGWFLTTLANSGDPLPYSVGRLAGWLVEPLLIYLVLAFPSGRLEARVDRLLVAAALVLVVTSYLPTALVVERYPVPVPWTSCDSGCPANAFMLTGSQPAFVDDVVRPLRELVTLALFAGVAWRLGQRIAVASRPLRRALMPVLTVSCLHFAAFFAILLGRRIAPGADLVAISTWLIALTVPLLAIAFLVGLARWWLFIARSTQRLAARLQGHPGPLDLQRALADVFDDRALVVVPFGQRGEDGRRDAERRYAEQLAARPGRRLTEVRDGQRLVAAIVHDASLGEDRAFLDTARSYTLMTLENRRLVAESRALLDEARKSRARIQEAADEERRRIERDLHDGAQQRLVALRISLALAAERSDDGDAEEAAVLRRFGDDVEAALEEVRSLASGIYPAPLADRGLVAALRSAALRSPLATSVVAQGIGRYPREIESAAYFCCLEALQNAAKHARGATATTIGLSDDGALHLDVRDDGAGFDTGAIDAGSGFLHMRDRLAAVGGQVAISSSPGRGTCVSGTIPLRAVEAS